MLPVSQDERERAIAISRKKFQTDYASDMATVEDRVRLAIARNALQMSMAIDDIVRLTGLTRE